MGEKLEKYDFVRVKTSHGKETDEFVGAYGIILEVNESAEYPYELIFIGKYLNKKSKELGDLLWKKYQLEAV